MLPVLIALALLTLGLLWRGKALLLLVAALGYIPVTNPSSDYRSKVISTVTAISATTTDCDEAAGYYEIPRGAQDISFTFLATLNTGYSAGTVYFTGSIVGADSPSDTFVALQSALTTAELVVDVAQTIPSAANAPGVVLPRFIKVKWTETGSMSSFTATCTIRYTLTAGAGRQYAADYVGG